jgi:hypothetical protein
MKLSGVPRLLYAVATAVAMTTAGAGCGSSKSSGHTGSKKAEVASLAKPSGAAAGSASAQDRPRLRLDMSSADTDIAMEPWDRCMAEHGVPDKKAMYAPDGTLHLPSNEVWDSASRACESSYPLPPWEWDRANPDAADFAHRVVLCLQGRGVKYVEISNDASHGEPTYSISLGGPDNDSDSIQKGMANMKSCQQEAAAKKGG